MLNTFRLGIILKCLAPVTMTHQQAGLIYALLAEANGRALRIEPVLPANLIPEPVEHCRRHVARHARWAFACTLFAENAYAARHQIDLLLRGLRLLGREPARRQLVLGGNFRVDEVRDLVAKRVLHQQTPPEPISEAHLLREIEQAQTFDRFTLRFATPLRMARSKHGLSARKHPVTGKIPKPAYMDHRHFDAAVFLRRVAHRVGQHGLSLTFPEESSTEPRVVENALVWYDVQYGPRDREKHLPGALGDVVLSGLSKPHIAQLVQAQYLHVGENTRFGHGRFRIAQLGPDPFACQRTESLRELALEPRYVDPASARLDLPPGRMSQLVAAIRAGRYTPQPPTQINIRSGARERVLSIPHRDDRALQRAVHDFLAPTLDRVLEASSLAYRRGRHREDAANQIKRAAAAGYAWALKADFADFFDTVDHGVLKQRLRCYIADPALEGLIMSWVRTGSPQPNKGLPTGAVISPLLANLFLDEFDENIAAAGGRLLRYADDCAPGKVHLR